MVDQFFTHRKILLHLCLLLVKGTLCTLNILACSRLNTEQIAQNKILHFLIAITVITCIVTFIRMYNLCVYIHFFCKGVYTVHYRYLILEEYNFIFAQAYILTMSIMSFFYFSFNGIKCGDLSNHTCIIIKINLWIFMGFVFICVFLFCLFFILVCIKGITESLDTRIITNIHMIVNMNNITIQTTPQLVDNVKEECCSICLELFDDQSDDPDMSIVKVKCGHNYHNKCIHKWSNRGHSTCPVCREIIATNNV
jgi:hypothetical protein